MLLQFYPIYPDKTVGALFFEPSTRTKLSFEIAALNLGARFIDFNCSQSSLKKGESIKDTIETISLMGVDTMIIRSKEDFFEDLTNELPNINFVNAGQGTFSHPTQALTDYMTINEFSKSENHSFSGVGVGVGSINLQSSAILAPVSLISSDADVNK